MIANIKKKPICINDIITITLSLFCLCLYQWRDRKKEKVTVMSKSKNLQLCLSYIKVKSNAQHCTSQYTIHNIIIIFNNFDCKRFRDYLLYEIFCLVVSLLI